MQSTRNTQGAKRGIRGLSVTVAVATALNLALGERTLAEPPPNDSCAAALLVGEGEMFGTLTDAASEGIAACDESPDTLDVWYAYLPYANALLNVSSDSAADVMLSIWPACPGGADLPLACGGNSVSAQVIAGQMYLIRFSASPILNPGDFVFNVRTGLHAFGLPHYPLGDADIWWNPSDIDGVLELGNIGGTGNDGVRTEQGEVDSFIVYRLLEAVAPSAELLITSTGEIGGPPDQPVATFALLGGPSGTLLAPDFSAVGEVAYQYQVYNGTELVGVLPAGPIEVVGALSSFAAGNPGDVDPMVPNIGCCGWYSGTWTMRPCKWCPISGGTPVYAHKQPAGYVWCGCAPDIAFPWWRFFSLEQAALTFAPAGGGETLSGDSVVIVPLAAPGPVTLSATEITAAGVPSLSIEGYPVWAHGHAHRAIGQALLNPERVLGVGDMDLHLSNIGGTGQDGVLMAVPNLPREEIAFHDLDLSTPNAYVDVQALGEVDGVADQIISGIRFTGLGGGAVAFAPLSEAGQTHTVRVFNQDRLVAAVETETGDGFTFTGPSWVTVGKDSRDRNGTGTGGRFPAPTSITINGGPTVIGDEIRISTHAAAGQQPRYGDVNAVQVLAAEVGSFTIAGAEAPPRDSIETFEAFPAGTDIQGLYGWSGWDDVSTGGVAISSAQAVSGTNSLSIQGAADLVTRDSVFDDGVWVWAVSLLVPQDFVSGCDAQGNCGSYVILMNTYEAGGPKNWSLLLHADSITDQFIRDGQAGGSLPLIRGEWVELSIRIDLEEDTMRVFYGGVELGQEASWLDASQGDDGWALPKLRLAAANLFANGSSVVYYDDIRVTAYEAPNCPADLNGDGMVDQADLAQLLASYGSVGQNDADIDGDGVVGQSDLAELLGVYGTTCP